MFNIFKVKTTFPDVSKETLFDVLMDSKYRLHWDKYMKETYELGHMDTNNNISYFGSKNLYFIESVLILQKKFINYLINFYFSFQCIVLQRRREILLSNPRGIKRQKKVL